MSKWRIDIAMTDKTSQDRRTVSLDEHREADGQTDRSKTRIAFYHWLVLSNVKSTPSVQITLEIQYCITSKCYREAATVFKLIIVPMFITWRSTVLLRREKWTNVNNRRIKLHVCGQISDLFFSPPQHAFNLDLPPDGVTLRDVWMSLVDLWKHRRWGNIATETDRASRGRVRARRRLMKPLRIIWIQKSFRLSRHF